MASTLTPNYATRQMTFNKVYNGVGSRGMLGTATGKLRLPTDSIGNFTLTLTNLVVGSSIRIETEAGALIEYRVADATTEVFTAPAYSVGNAANNLRIKVRKASEAPFYIPYETLTTAFVGAQSIYVSQIPDE